jgi:hypothetical protein
MELENTQAYYDIATITGAVKSFIGQAPGLSKLFLFNFYFLLRPCFVSKNKYLSNII